MRVITRNTRQKRTSTKYSTRKWFKDEKFCYFCNHDFSVFQNITRFKKTAEHIVPLTIGGNNSRANVVACCYGCNADRAKLLNWFVQNRFDEEARHFIHECYILYIWRLYQIYGITSTRELLQIKFRQEKLCLTSLCEH